MSCRHLGLFLVETQTLRDLNLSSCRIKGQGARYILEGFDYNKTLNYINLSFNDMTSESYEYSSKIGKILSRHPNLMHVDLTTVGLRKEEVLFVCLAINHSRSILSLHLSGNQISYYERIYLRSLMKATVQYMFKNVAENKNVNTKREHNQFRELTSEDYQSNDVRSYFENRNFIDFTKNSLDEHSTKLLKEIDFNNIFKEIGENALNEEQQKKFEGVLEHIKKKSEFFKLSHMAGLRFNYDAQTDHEAYDMIKSVEDPRRLTLYNGEKDLKYQTQIGNIKKDNWELMKKLKTERMRQRFDSNQKSGKKQREQVDPRISMLYLDKTAYDINLENPMTGYMNEVIFTRIVGHDDILRGDQWKDAAQCWICEKWAKQVVQFEHKDEECMRQNISQLEQLKKTIQECINNKSQVQTTIITPNQAFTPASNVNPRERRMVFSEGRVDSRNEQMRIKDKAIQKISLNKINYQNLEISKIEKEKAQLSRLQQQISNPFSSLFNRQQLEKTILPENYPIRVNFKSKQPIKASLDQSMDASDDQQQYKPVIDVTVKIKQDNKVQIQNDNYKSINKQKESYKKVEMDAKNKYDSDFESEASIDDFQKDQKLSIKYSLEIKKLRKEKIKQEQNKEAIKTLDEYNKTQDINTDGLDIDEIYLVGSFNNWFPVKMLKIQEILQENQQEEEDQAETQQTSLKQEQLPAPTSLPDDPLGPDVLRYVNFLPPGKHYFYFIKNLRYYFLSPRYEIIRFKGTHLYLNQIVVYPRIQPLQELKTKKGKQANTDKRFVKERSVFKQWKEENDDMLRKMFESDMGYSKLHRILKNNEDEMREVKETLFVYYKSLKNIFILYASISTYPVISWNDFTNFCYKCRIIDKNLNLSTLDRVFITTNVALHKFSSSAERCLQRYEFMEILIRLANAKFKETNICLTTSDALEHILPNAEYVDSKIFRDKILYTYDVNEILARNETPLKKLYDSYIHPNKKYLTLKECIEIVNKKADLKMIETTIGYCFAQSLMSIIDTVKDQTRSDQMKYVEFLDFIGRISYEHFKDTQDEELPLHIKIDKIISPLFKSIHQQKQFTFLQSTNTIHGLDKKFSSVNGIFPSDMDPNFDLDAEILGDQQMKKSQITDVNEMDISLRNLIQNKNKLKDGIAPRRITKNIISYRIKY